MKEATQFDWTAIGNSLHRQGFARVESILTPDECAGIIALYTKDEIFRSTINMQRYRFGMGEYRYFNYPLPRIVQSLREMIYPSLAPVANEWMWRLGTAISYPEKLEEFLRQCQDKGQNRPTPLLLRYEEGGYNTLHQDLYGDVFFPFQVVFMLSEPGKDYNGGELVFVEQLPRAQSRSVVVRPKIGDAVIFTTSFRPIEGSRGYYRSRMKHGVSTVHWGLRHTMGLIFHDAGVVA